MSNGFKCPMGLNVHHSPNSNVSGEMCIMVSLMHIPPELTSVTHRLITFLSWAEVQNIYQKIILVNYQSSRQQEASQASEPFQARRQNYLQWRSVELGRRALLPLKYRPLLHRRQLWAQWSRSSHRSCLRGRFCLLSFLKHRVSKDKKGGFSEKLRRIRSTQGPGLYV